ncbi:7,8-didemethyl-8-hydroxy-5-deazariboflavin synthase / 5-amino-6-(D-ribitylamino)uracil--L-tyrosine 4-hydroxyphenyl transferase [Hyphomicrobiales bacterium]|nr:7,8-didemethyl-8-hydroxy-5-deazariboflavin synthase / 5-amino-6-(D-ribitylamino)uracil--L-tyrosine 4-hydroxyphenyl transferase [Hyphomicrobiales bacterium]CAH1692034.1 7,8-didemethyl-8-hydroxy-5-deazariboflavin synthase / 5-amino-6-(D-ribitylamino)uracil--L-tyrosine 4-hydroxyphenyl transferase [Hyphomicrobiales bacterium]
MTSWARPSAEEAWRLAQRTDTAVLCAEAAKLRDLGWGDLITVSRKVFVPLTMLCRDVCHYCTFAKAPRKVGAAYLSVEDVLRIARDGLAAGCDEVLFTLGDKPELRYRAAREALDAMGFATTVDYLLHVAAIVLDETGLLPHVNAGVMSEADLRRLREVSASQGLMLETAADRLGERGGAHFGSPDKAPEARLAVIEAAGHAKVPFTTGLLIGIGETRSERVEALLQLRNLHERYGHIQEIIIQNFRAKPGTRMAGWPEPDLDDHRWTIALARMIFGPGMSIQAPPNLRSDWLEALIDAGINDWGGVSPITADHVNPEAPWPKLETLAARSASAGKALAPRLAVYPRHATSEWLSPRVRAAHLRRADGAGLAQEGSWRVGEGGTGTSFPAPQLPASGDIARCIDAAEKGRALSPAEIAGLFAARGSAAEDIYAAADGLRRAVNGNTVSYVVTRNINYTNICSFSCSFCAFSKGSRAKELSDSPYDLTLEEIQRRVREAWDRGATEVCMQGGIHPDYSGETYLEICRAVKAAAPDIHVHAFSPLEVAQGAASLGIPVSEFLERLKEAGLGTLPGTAAEVLVDGVRDLLCPGKLGVKGWLDVVRQAHKVGFRTTSTIMFGHVDTYLDWGVHLNRLRDLQSETGGFTEFVPLPFVHMEAPLYKRGLARQGPSLREAVLMHAIARLALAGSITNIQGSWVKMGVQGVAHILRAGVNDLGGTLMNESISRAAGSLHGQECPPHEMEAKILAAGLVPRQRTTLYADAPESQRERSFTAAPLVETVNDPVQKRARIGSRAGLKARLPQVVGP